MGFDKYTYLGPFLKVKNEKVDVTTEVTSCPNTNCKNHKKTMTAGFCSLCGSKIGPVSKIKRQDKVDVSDLLVDQLKETLSQVIDPTQREFNGFIYILPNVDRKPPRKYFIDNDGGFSVTTDINKDQDLDWFKTAFTPEIEKLKLAYGEYNVEVIWGLLTYCY